MSARFALPRVDGHPRDSLVQAAAHVIRERPEAAQPAAGLLTRDVTGIEEVVIHGENRRLIGKRRCPHEDALNLRGDARRAILEHHKRPMPTRGLRLVHGASSASHEGGGVLPLLAARDGKRAMRALLGKGTRGTGAGAPRQQMRLGHAERTHGLGHVRPLELARLADFLRGQDGLATRLAENAANLSGGQRQRLSLARAILHNSPVYIFDEATSNVYVESEQDIMDAICGLARYKAVVVISHRLANAVPARRIYVLDHGVLAGAGTHEELLDGCAEYRALWSAQAEFERLSAGDAAVDAVADSEGVGADE